jgi:hypothetical protein
MIGLVVTIILVGVLLWLAETYVPMAAPVKTILRAVVVIALVLYVLQVFGVFNMASSVPVPRVR